MAIILFDIPSTLPSIAWSPNTWKTRFCLNYKQIPYQTQWIEYPDIEHHCKTLGIAPTIGHDGKTSFTLPAIHDPSTGAYISDSFAIADYLERTYPDTPQLFPRNTAALQTAYTPLPMSTIMAVFPIAIPVIFPYLPPRSQEYFRATRERDFGKMLEDISPQGEPKAREWAKVREGLTKIDSWYSHAKIGGEETGPFLLGDVLSWADIVVAGYFTWWRLIWGECSEEWKDIENWNGGRWKELSEQFRQYESVL